MKNKKDDALMPLLVIISGPSGVGKDALLSRMREQGCSYYFTITATTRPKRAGEQDGKDYFFLSKEEFLRLIKNDELLEWAQVYGNYYGVPKTQVREALERGQDVIIKTDVQGAATIRSKVPDTLLIFLEPPSLVELEHRLRARMTESSSDMGLRLETAKEEMSHRALFDYAVVNQNGRLDDAVAQVEAIIQKEKRRRPARIAKV